MSWAFAFLRSTIGRKVVMAITGLMLFGFVIGHLLGNLQIFIPDGGAKINAYGKFLHDNAGLLWGARIGLLVAVLLHIWTAISLATTNREARPVPYVSRNWRNASYASRTMMISGPLVGLFVIYHLLHFTVGNVHPDPQHLPGSGAWNVHHNVIAGFSDWKAAFVYIIAMAMLGLHLRHGAWSMFQSMGVNHPKYTPMIRRGMEAVAALITIGNISIPVAVLCGFIK